MSSSEPEGIVVAIDGNVLLMTALELLDGRFNVLHATFFAPREMISVIVLGDYVTERGS